MVADDQEKIEIAREYFSGRLTRDAQTPLICSRKMLRFIFQNSASGFWTELVFLKWLKDSKGVLEYIQHDYDRLDFIPSRRLSRRWKAHFTGQNVWKVVGRRQNSWRAFLQRFQVSRWPNIEPAHLSRS